MELVPTKPRYRSAREARQARDAERWTEEDRRNRAKAPRAAAAFDAAHDALDVELDEKRRHILEMHAFGLGMGLERGAEIPEEEADETMAILTAEPKKCPCGQDNKLCAWHQARAKPAIVTPLIYRDALDMAAHLLLDPWTEDELKIHGEMRLQVRIAKALMSMDRASREQAEAAR